MSADLRAAAEQAWPAFVLVTGLLLTGFAAGADGVFAWAAARMARARVPPLAVFGLALAAIAVVTALLNLDTSVVFLTPLLVGLARASGLDELPFLYASVLMANASSLFLPGSNLTNLLVLAREDVSGGVYAARTLPAALAAALVTAATLTFTFRGRLKQRGTASANPGPARPGAVGACAVVLVAALTVALPQPAIPVLVAGALAAVAVGRRRGTRARELLAAASPAVTLALFLAAIALGTLARAWSGPAQLLAHAGRWGGAAIGALAAVGVNNLPAAVLLSAQPPQHARALLIGLNVGPNLAVTGSLSAYLWFRAARGAGARPSAREFSRRGIPIALLAGTAALLAITLI